MDFFDVLGSYPIYSAGTIMFFPHQSRSRQTTCFRFVGSPVLEKVPAGRQLCSFISLPDRLSDFLLQPFLAAEGLGGGRGGDEQTGGEKAEGTQRLRR